MAENCEIKMTIDYDKNDIEECGFTNKDCQTYLGNDSPFIINSNEFADIIDEHTLWDRQHEGKQPLIINIQPKMSYLATIARYRSKGTYIEIAENRNKPRVFLKVVSDNKNKEPKRYILKITLCGNNFSPVVKEEHIQLEAKDYDPRGKSATLS